MDSSTAELIILYQAAADNVYWTSGAFALLIYDYVLTFSREIHFVWGRRFSAATVLFLLNRYFLILLYLVDLVTLFPIIPSTCSGIGTFIVVLEVFPYIIWSTFSSLRSYALSGRNRLIGGTIFLLALVPAGVNAYFFSTFAFVNLAPPSNCTAVSDITAYLSKTLTIVSRTSLITTDLLVIVVTWWSTYRIGKISRDLRIGASFGTLLLRDGTVYFIVLLAMNIGQIVLNTVKPNNAVQQASYISVLENAYVQPLGVRPAQPLLMAATDIVTVCVNVPVLTSMTSILISRFILNLREIDEHTGDGSANTSSFGGAQSHTQSATMQFAPAPVSSSVFVGALGAPLKFGFAEDDPEYSVSFGEDSGLTQTQVGTHEMDLVKSEERDSGMLVSPTSYAGSVGEVVAYDSAV